jgi:Ca-activated chloride channel homolog
MIPLRAALPLLLALVATATPPQFKPANPQQQPSPNGKPPLDPVPQKDGSETPHFAIKVNLVRLLVTVRDGEGALVPHLGKNDFHIFDSGVPQDIALFEQNTSVPLSVAVLMDTSASVQNDLHYEEDSVLRFVAALLDAGNQQDAFALFTFNWRTNLESDFSRSRKRAEHVLHNLRADGGTSLYDAVYLASDVLSGREGRHVLILVTDGGDTTSYKKYNDALAAAQRSDVIMYPIVVVPIQGDAGRNTGGEHALSTLAASTGGRIFNPEGFERLNEAFADILRELRMQYLLGFYPQGTREEPRLYHPVNVALKDASLRVTARSGYYEP